MLKDEVRTKSYRSSIYGSKHIFKAKPSTSRFHFV